MKYERDHVTYVVVFTGGRVKIGVTKQWPVRLATYVREAERQGCKVSSFAISLPMGKRFALELERETKAKYACFALPGHAETFENASCSALRVSMLAVGLSPMQRIAHFCGQFNARNSGQRAAVVVDVCANDIWFARGVRA